MRQLIEFLLSDAGQRLIQNVIAIVAIIFALRGVRNWNRERRDLRRAELAEQAIALGYKARDAFSAVRSPIGFGGEGSSRKQEDNESDSLKRARDRAYTPIERLKYVSAVFDEVQSARYSVTAAFGEKYSLPLLEFLKVRNEIVAVAHTKYMMAEDITYGERRDQSFDRKFEGTIWEGVSKPDAIKERLDAAVEKLENEFRQYVEARFTVSPILWWWKWPWRKRRH